MHPFYYVSLPKPHKKEQAEQKKQWKKSIDQGCQISWISQESPGFEIFLLAENLLISGADFRYFLLILVLFPDIYQLHFYQPYDGILAESIRKYTIIQLKSRGDTGIYFFEIYFPTGFIYLLRIYLFVTDLFICYGFIYLLRIYLLYQDFVAPSVLFIGILSSAPSLWISPSPILGRDDRIYFEIHGDF